MLQVVEIELDALAHGFDIVAPGVAVYLGPPGDARLHFVSNHVTGYLAAIVLVHRDGVWAGPDDAHGAFEDIEELRQLIERGPANEGAHPGDALVAAAGGLELGL